MIKSTEEPIQEAAFPSGTVTFLFTDIEGSTKLLEMLHEQYATLLEEQRDLLRAAFARWNGYEIDTQGDAFFSAFPRALDGVSCAVEIQRELAEHSWPQGVTLRVRMGLHTGEPVIARTGYVGMDVHRAARIASAGYGGQVLVSQTTRELIYQDLPSGTRLRDLGEYKLKDIRFPQRIYQLDIEGLPGEFPELKTLSAAETPPTPGEAPYQGLRFFDENQAEWFFGRQKATARLVEAVMALQAYPPSSGLLRFLAIIGASGSGKSSVVRAGLVPSLKHAQPGGWQVHLITPGAHPLESLAVSLTKTSESVSATTTLIDDLRRDTRSLNLYLQKLSPASKPRLLLVIDQFEELFTQCREEVVRQAFIGNLLNAIGTDSHQATAVITLRADFYDRLAQYAQLREVVSANQVYIGAMSSDELSEAIEGPARRGGWELSPGLVELMLHDTGAGDGRQPEPGALPLLSHALLETWNRRRGNLLNLKAYTESGGVRGAIAHTAERVYHFELTTEQQEIARGIFLRLTELGEGTQDTRRRISIHELLPPGPASDAEQVQAVLLKLADARLITTGEGTVEVSHEALIREWPVLRDWLAADREGLRLHRHLTEAAQEWELLERDPGALYRGARLAQALEWALNNPRQLNAQEQAFLNASKESSEKEATEREVQRQRELEAARRLAEAEHLRADEQASASKRLRQRAVFLVIALVAVLGLATAALFFARQSGTNADLAATREALSQTNAERAAQSADQARSQEATALAESKTRATAESIAVQQRQIAEDQTRLTRSRELALAAVNSLEVDPERGILLALQALSTTRQVDGTVLPEAEEALHRSILASQVRLTLVGQHASVFSAVFSPDGKHLATYGRDGTAIVWDASNGKQLLRLPGSTEPGNTYGAQYLAFSPDGQRLAVADRSQVKIVEAGSGNLIMTLSGHTQAVWSVVFSPDGKRIATSGVDGSVRVWDAATGDSRLVLTGHRAPIESLTFSPDGKRLVTGSDDQTMKIWDAISGVLLVDRSDFPSSVDSAMYSPDGKYLVASSSGTLRIWEANAVLGHEILSIEENVGGATFSPDGTKLATITGSLAKVWDAHTGRELLTLAGHNNWVTSIAFSPDGKRLATTSFDETAKVWSITTGQEAILLSGKGLRVAYSPDGTRLATDGLDGFAHLWDAVTGKELQTLSGHTDSVMGIAFSPDGKRLATASLDKTAKVWNTATGQLLLTLSGHEEGLRDIAYSPDGSRIATASFDQTARVWDAVTGHELLKLAGHQGLVVGVAFSPDGTRIATSSTDTTAKIWDARTGQLLFTLSGHRNPIPDISFSPDGIRLATGSQDRTAKIWDATTGKELLTLSGHSSEIQSVSFSADGKFIATGSGDNTAIIWDVSTGKAIHTLPGNLGGVTGVAFNPLMGSHDLAVASNDGIVRVFPSQIEDVIALAHARITRSFTLEECQKYLHVEQCPAPGS